MAFHVEEHKTKHLRRTFTKWCAARACALVLTDHSSSPLPVLRVTFDCTQPFGVDLRQLPSPSKTPCWRNSMMWGIGCGAAGGVHRMWWGGFRMQRPLVWKACETAVVCFGVGSAVAWCVGRGVKAMGLLQFIQLTHTHPPHYAVHSGTRAASATC